VGQHSFIILIYSSKHRQETSKSTTAFHIRDIFQKLLLDSNLFNMQAPGYLQKFLIVTPSRTGYGSFETWLLHQIRNWQPLLEYMD